MSADPLRVPPTRSPVLLHELGIVLAAAITRARAGSPRRPTLTDAAVVSRLTGLRRSRIVGPRLVRSRT